MKRGKIILVLVLMSMAISFLVYSFAYTTTTHTTDDSSYIMVSEISFGLIDAVESINLNQQIPTIDKFGVSNESFSFSINNTGGKEQQYTLRLVDKETLSTIANEEVRYQLTRNGVVEDIKNLSGSGVIDSGVIAKGETYEYSIIVWLSYDAVTSGGTWDKAIKVEAGNVNIDASGANEPILLDNMIPVYYDEDDSVWKKADRTNSNTNYRWYDYDDRVWANAVTVYSTTDTDYFSATEGTEISMEDITMFYVWIPRFKYDLFESGSPKLINVTFEKGVENTGTMKCLVDEEGIETCAGEKISYTHPAFTFDNEELTGYWINKFELSPESSTTCYSDVRATNCNKNNLSITSKPNQKSLRFISVGNLFYSIRNMELSGNIHGFTNGGNVLNNDGTFDSDNNNYDVHLAKNFETAALSYLTYSKYGKYGNLAYSGENKHIFANSSNSKTGGSSIDGISYNYDIGYYGVGASTTGSVYGVYDINGTIKEFVMIGLIRNGGFYVYSSNETDFIGSPAKIYYDSFSFVNNSAFKAKYGDGTSEFSGFNENISSKPDSSTTTLTRNSITSLRDSYGETDSSIGGRSVITIEQDIYITKW